jgi:hypothetical protein
MDKFNTLPHFELSVGELNEEENITMTSLVNNPATDMKIQVFSHADPTEENVIKFTQMPSTDQYERIISGVWMMPDTKYYRVVNDFEFTVSFTKKDLKRALINYLKNDNADSFDYEHDGHKLSDLVSVEHWVIESKETRSPVMGYSLDDLGYLTEEIKKGTVMKTVYIKNEQFFNEMVLSGNVMGYSIEGLFNLNEVNTMVTEQFSNKNMFKALGLDQINGTVITNDGNLSFNKNTITLNDVKVIDGEYKTQLGFNIVIKKGTVVDFGFEEAQVSVAVESATNEQVEHKVEVTEPVVEQAVVTEHEQEVITVEPIVVVDTSKDELIAAQLAELNALKEQLALELKQKEELMKAKPIVSKTVIPTPSNLDNFIVREKNGVKHYIPKR